MDERKMVSIDEFLTDEQGKHVVRLFNELGSGSELHRRILEEVVLPNMDEIDRKLGQKNCPDYVAYMLEGACIETLRRLEAERLHRMN